jgi:hypothetical protein
MCMCMCVHAYVSACARACACVIACPRGVRALVRLFSFTFSRSLEAFVRLPSIMRAVYRSLVTLIPITRLIKGSLHETSGCHYVLSH